MYLRLLTTLPCVKNISCVRSGLLLNGRKYETLRYKFSDARNSRFNMRPTDMMRFVTPKTVLGVCSSIALSATAYKLSVRAQTAEKEAPVEIKVTCKQSLAVRTCSVFLRLAEDILDSLKLIIRTCKLTILFLPIIVLWPITLIVPPFKSMWWGFLLYAIECSGPIFIKLGQWASSRRDLFSDEFCDRFSRLQRSTSSHSLYYTLNQMEKEFGPDWRDFFVMFDPIPVGSGCVAQIYKAYIKGNEIQKYTLPTERSKNENPTLLMTVLETTGLSDFLGWNDRIFLRDDFADDDHIQKSNLIPVAIKILHPSINRLLKRDLRILDFSSSFIEFVCPSTCWLDLRKCFIEFQSTMNKQIDLTVEARNLIKFEKNFQNTEDVCFPKPIYPFVTPTVLVETFAEGEPISNYIKDGLHNEEFKKKIASLGMRSLLKMIFQDNFVHGDLHPGNIIVQQVVPEESFFERNFVTSLALTFFSYSNRLPSHLSKPRLVMLDCGLAAALSQEHLSYFSKVFSAIILGKSSRVGELFLECSRHQCADPEGFKTTMTSLVDEARDGLKKMDGLDAHSLMSRLFNTLVRYRVRLEGGFISVVLAMAVVEGLGHSLDPELDVLDTARPFVMYV